MGTDNDESDREQAMRHMHHMRMDSMDRHHHHDHEDRGHLSYDEERGDRGMHEHRRGESDRFGGRTQAMMLDFEQQFRSPLSEDWVQPRKARWNRKVCGHMHPSESLFFPYLPFLSKRHTSDI